MRNTFGSFVFGFAAVLFLLSADGYGQIWGGQDAAAVDQLPPGANKSAPGSTGTLDPHDLTGVWLTNHRGTNGYRGMTTEEGIPPRTPSA